MSSWKLHDWFSFLRPEELDKLKRFNDELVKFNPTLNLVSQKTLNFSDVIHFSDTILASQLIRKDLKFNKIYDLGSGNGFPGLVFAILYSDVEVILLDRDIHKVEFLTHVSQSLKLTNVKIECNTIESIPDNSLNAAMCRGLSSVSKIALLLRKQVSKDGAVYLLKGEEWVREVSQIPTQLCSYWIPELVSEYRLPLGEVKFAVVKLNKIA